MDEPHEGEGLASPAWAAFGDLMAGVLGAFVLVLAAALVGQLDLADRLDAETRQRQAEQQRRERLERALAGPLADGRITLMFCSFDERALILRIYGRGRAVLPQDADWDEVAAHFTLLPGTRQIFDIAVESVQTSCGWGVPMMELQHERETLRKYHRQADPVLWVEKLQGRTKSIDGLPTRPTDRFIAG